MKLSFDSVTVVGCGGIGTWLVPPLARILACQGFKGPVHLWDGDKYEEGNANRQEFAPAHLGVNKAEAMANVVRASHPVLDVVDHREFVLPDNVDQAVAEYGLMVTCLDNNPARALIEGAARKLRNVCVLSAGNELMHGNVHVLIRRDGKDATQPLLLRHPEVGTDKRGDRIDGCERLIEEGETQLLTTNFMAAASVLFALHLLCTHGERADGRKQETVPQEIWFGIWDGINVVPVFKGKEAEPCRS